MKIALFCLILIIIVIGYLTYAGKKNFTDELTLEQAMMQRLCYTTPDGEFRKNINNETECLNGDEVTISNGKITAFIGKDLYI